MGHKIISIALYFTEEVNGHPSPPSAPSLPRPLPSPLSTPVTVDNCSSEMWYRLT